MKYLKKSVIIEAVQWYGKNIDTIRKFVKNGIDIENNKLYINTLEGKVEVNNRDFIIRGVEGEYYPCSENKFNKFYSYVSGTAYKKNPMEIEAEQYNGKLESICEFCPIYKMNENKKLMVRTSDGKWLIASKNDFIIKEDDGGYHPVKPNIFKKTYEEIK